jgi:dynactin-6
MDIEADDRLAERLEPYTVIYGGNSERRLWDGKNLEAGQNLRIKHLEYLREILPK